MVNWLKYYFLGFFSNGLSKEGAKRSGFNLLLNILLAFILLCGGFVAGYAASFPVFYSKAEDFKSFVYSAFAEENGNGKIQLEARGGKFIADVPNQKGYTNGFTDGNAYGKNGYVLVVDTRPAEQTFDDFAVKCTDPSGKEIGVEEYRNLSESDKAKASFKIEYTGKELDVKGNQAEYIAFLDRVADKNDKEYSAVNAEKYAKLKEERASGKLDEDAYARGVYTLFVKAYYPSFNKIEMHGEAPTLRTYYLGMAMGVDAKKCLVILDDLCVCSFESVNGIRLDFGSYVKVKDGVISADGLSAAEARSNIDGLIKKAFSDSVGFNLLLYVINVFKAMIFILAAVAIIALIVFAVCRFADVEFGKNYLDTLKIIGSYLTVSALLAFIAAFVFSFFMARNQVFILAEITVIVVVVVRAVILTVMEIIKNRREKKNAAINEQE